MKKVVLIALLFCVGSSVAIAQSEDGKAKSGSVYSKLGIGFPVDIGSASARSLGLSGVSYNEINVANLANPAHWGNLVYGLGAGGVGLESFDASQGDNTAQNTHFSIDQFQLQFPVIRGKFGISASFSPVTQSSFRNYQEDVRYTGEGSAQDTLIYGIENRGSGGANRAEIGFGWQISQQFSVGYAASAVFVSLDDQFTGVFANSDYQSVTYQLETSGYSFGNRFGAFFRQSELFNEDDELGIGASVSLPVTIGAEREQTSTQGGRTIAISESDGPQLGSGDISLPLNITAGVSYQPGELSMLAAEGSYEGWSNFKNDFKSSEEDLFTDRYKMGLGFQYFPYITGSNKFLSQFKYRLGASYDTGHLEIQGQKINTLKFSFGLGVLSPRSNSNSSMDLSLEYGLRGTNSANLVKEQIWGVRLSLNLAEIMFFRPKLQ